MSPQWSPPNAPIGEGEAQPEPEPGRGSVATPPPPVLERNAWSTHPWPPRFPDGLWSPLAAGFLTLLVGGLGLWADNSLWLFPSLGPTIYLQTEAPDQPSSQIKHVLGGQFIGMLAGYLAVFALGIADQPPIFALGQLSAARVFAAVIAMVITEGGVLLADVSHPPAAATTLLIALGAFRPTLRSAASLVAGLVIVAFAGEAFRHLRLGNIRRYGKAR